MSVDEIMMNRIWKQRDDLVKENQRLHDRIKRLEKAGESVNDAIMSVQDWSGTHVGDCLDAWHKAKEAKL